MAQRPPGWFFDSVGMGLRPAELHEKPALPGLGPPGTDKTAMDFRRLLPEIRWQSCLSPVPGTGCLTWFFDPVGMGLRPAKLHEKRWGRRFRLPTLDPSPSGWQAEAPAPPTAPTGQGPGGFSILSPSRALARHNR